MSFSKSPTYTIEELDLQYNARATVDDATIYMREYGELTADSKKRLLCLEGIPYSNKQEETMDIYPSGSENAPVFVFIHGGYWRALSKNDSGFMAPAFTEAGAMVIALDYALAPAVTLDEIVNQVRTALVWIHRNIRRYGGDPDRIYVCGSSAGGHLVGMLLQDGWHEIYGAPPSLLKGAVSISGLFDLRPLVGTHINEWLRLELSDAERNSPMLRLGTFPCPLVVAVAEKDTSEFKQQSMLYAEKWREKGNEILSMEIPDTNHFDILFDLMKSDSSLFIAIASLMKLNSLN